MKNPLHISLLHCPSFLPFLLLLSLILIHHLPLSSIPTDLCRDCPSSWISKNLFLRDLASRINSKSLWFLRFCFVFPVSLIYHCDYGIFGFISFFDFFYLVYQLNPLIGPSKKMLFLRSTPLSILLGESIGELS